MAARRGTERGRGVPLTDAERQARHLAIYGTDGLPSRGTGLAVDPERMGTVRVLWVAGGAGVGAGTGVFVGDMIGGRTGGVLGAILGAVVGSFAVDRIIHAIRS